jgi:hypothetical protein
MEDLRFLGMAATVDARNEKKFNELLRRRVPDRVITLSNRVITLSRFHAASAPHFVLVHEMRQRLCHFPERAAISS